MNMDLTVLKPENILVRTILDRIKDFDWHDIELNIKFKGKKIANTFGLGFEAREFKVKECKNKPIKYLSPLEKRKIKDEHNEELLRINRKRGGEALAKKWAAKRRSAGEE